MKATRITAAEFDERFDRGEDITEFLDLDNVRRPGLEPKKVRLDLPSWMVEALDREAERSGMTRQELTKSWLAERLEQAA